VSEPREIMILADIRFPLERANGVQIVKTAAALAASLAAFQPIIGHKLHMFPPRLSVKVFLRGLLRVEACHQLQKHEAER